MLRNWRKIITIVPLCMILLAAWFSCTDKQEKESEKKKTILRLATTTSTVQSGLFDVLIPVFESKYNITVTVIARGTGAALQLARDGKADVVLVHAKEAEDTFVMEGYGVNRRDVMYNDFVILGPPEDPLQVKGENDALIVLKKIFDQKAPFISRGDNSGTHMREMNLWRIAGLKPEGNWYRESKESMLETLKAASKQKAYTLSDRSTYLYNLEELDLIVVVEGDKRLLNPYGVIAVNPEKVSGVNFKPAMAFVDFLTSLEGQEIISGYGRMKFGMPLFTPMAINK